MNNWVFITSNNCVAEGELSPINVLPILMQNKLLLMYNIKTMVGGRVVVGVVVLVVDVQYQNNGQG